MTKGVSEATAVRIARELTHLDLGGRLATRVRTNAPEVQVRARLRALGVDALIESTEREADPLRERGGSAVLVRWRDGVALDAVRAALEAL